MNSARPLPLVDLERRQWRRDEARTPRRPPERSQ